MHEEAVEAAIVAMYGHKHGGIEPAFMRRAIAAFLRAWSPSEEAVNGMITRMPGESAVSESLDVWTFLRKQIADELEKP